MNFKSLAIFLLLFECLWGYMELEVITSLIESHNKTQIVLAFLCNKKDAVVLLKHFSKSLHQVNVMWTNRYNLPYPVPPYHVSFVLDGMCPSAKQLVVNANTDKYFANPFKWIIYYNESLDVAEIIETYFTEVDILVDSDVTVAIKQNPERFMLSKLYKPHVNSKVLVEDVGLWTKRGGYIDNGYEKISYKRRRNLGGVVLKSCIVLTNNDSLNHLTDKRHNHIDSLAKVDYILVEHLADTINATLSYSIEDNWGYKNAKSEWSGMIGQLTRKKADIGGSGLFVTTDRIKIIEYVAMTAPTRSKFIFREPKLSYVSNVYTLPFHVLVWISVGALLVVMALALYVVVKWEWYKKRYIEISNESNEIELPNSGLEVAFTAVAVLCQQGAFSIPFSVPGRITLLFLLVSFMFLYTSYSANIVALLQSSSNNIQTLQDLLHSGLDVGVDDTIFNHFFFSNETEPVRRALYLQKVAPPGKKPNFYSLDEGISRVRQGLFAFHAEEGPAYKLIRETFQEDEKCGLGGISFLQVPDPWLAIQKNSSYKKMLQVGLRLLQETGIQSRESGLIYTKKPPCLSRGSSFISVGLVDCYSAAVVLAGGMGASLVILIVETYFHKRIKYYRRGLRRQKFRSNLADAPG